MSTQVSSFVAATYVRDIARSRVFYAALGFAESSAGANESSAWSYLHHNGHLILLATSDPPVEIPALPLLFYFFVDDLALASATLTAVGHPVEPVGFPPHARGGEAKTHDPDGNTVLLGQPEPWPTGEPDPLSPPSERFSLLREAAALARHRVAVNLTCQVGGRSQACAQPAEVKLADSWGATVWACLPHAEETLIDAPGAFIASQDGQGLEPFLARRRRP